MVLAAEECGEGVVFDGGGEEYDAEKAARGVI